MKKLSFEEKFSLLEEYYREHGHLDIKKNERIVKNGQ